MVRDADAALYRAKAKGRGRYEVFDPTMNAKALERLELEADLRAALERNEFMVYYQPKINLATGRLEGMEALVRWQHPRRGLVSPAAFIPLAEETGLIRPLGQWVLEEACRQTKLWLDRNPDLQLVTSVNLSARQFQQPTLVDDVARALRESGVDPHNMQLEITESVAMEDAETAVTILQQLKDLGLQLAIDDFGTGYSSLAYLKRFPVDELKIDRAFVSGLLHESEDASIVNAVASLGHALKLSIVAEGIETADESWQVHNLGCEVGQGFYFARPLPSNEANAFILRSKHHAA
jgi:EAL domain-containing protein (putative c-di-GMP-specific phosphodiesterase class I)